MSQDPNRSADDPPARPAGQRSFFEELRHREVFKTAGIYAGGAWLLTEVLLAILERSALPESVSALAGCALVTVFVGGFPVAMLLAWYFDLSRAGLSRTAPPARGNRSVALAALGAVLAATAVLLWQLNPCGLGRVLGVAVLPCSYYGPADHEHEAPAVAEELNYRLSHLPQLRVPAWAGVRRLSSQLTDPAELAGQLGTDRLVECGLRRSESRLALNLQLYDPVAGHNLWADEYEGQAADQLLLISESFRDLIGVHALNLAARAGGRIERVNAAPTASTGAWSLFQEARSLEQSGDIEGAVTRYREAVEFDPAFARAHAAIARNLLRLAEGAGQDPGAAHARLDAAWAHTRQALQLAPDSAVALALRRELLARGLGEAETGGDPSLPPTPEALHQRIVELRPSYAQEYLWWAAWLESQGRHGEARAARETARELDPAGALWEPAGGGTGEGAGGRR